jgi:hypothetical protein
MMRQGVFVADKSSHSPVARHLEWLHTDRGVDTRTVVERPDQ